MRIIPQYPLLRWQEVCLGNGTSSVCHNNAPSCGTQTFCFALLFSWCANSSASIVLFMESPYFCAWSFRCLFRLSNSLCNVSSSGPLYNVSTAKTGRKNAIYRFAFLFSKDWCESKCITRLLAFRILYRVLFVNFIQTRNILVFN